MAYAVLEESDGQVVFSAKFKEALRRVAGQILSTRPTANIGRMHSRLLSKAILDTTNRPLTIDDVASLVVSIGPHVREYMTALAFEAGVVTGTDGAFVVAQELRSALAEVLAERRSYRSSAVAAILSEIVKSVLLASRRGVVDHHLLTLFVWYVLALSNFQKELRRLFGGQPA